MSILLEHKLVPMGMEEDAFQVARQQVEIERSILLLTGLPNNGYNYVMHNDYTVRLSSKITHKYFSDTWHLCYYNERVYSVT